MEQGRGVRGRVDAIERYVRRLEWAGEAAIKGYRRGDVVDVVRI